MVGGSGVGKESWEMEGGREARACIRKLNMNMPNDVGGFTPMTSFFP